MNDLPNTYKQFVNNNLKFILDLHKLHFKENDELTYGIIYICKKPHIDENDKSNIMMDISYLTFDILSNNSIIPNDTINDLKKIKGKIKVMVLDDSNHYLLII